MQAQKAPAATQRAHLLLLVDVLDRGRHGSSGDGIAVSSLTCIDQTRSGGNVSHGDVQTRWEARTRTWGRWRRSVISRQFDGDFRWLHGRAKVQMVTKQSSPLRQLGPQAGLSFEWGVQMNGESCPRCRPRCGVEEPQVRVVARIAALLVNTQRRSSSSSRIARLFTQVLLSATVRFFARGFPGAWR